MRFIRPKQFKMHIKIINRTANTVHFTYTCSYSTLDSKMNSEQQQQLIRPQVQDAHQKYESHLIQLRLLTNSQYSKEKIHS